MIRAIQLCERLRALYAGVNALEMHLIAATITSSHHQTHRTSTHTQTHTSREGELNLLVDDLHGDEVVLLIESAIVEQQSVSLSGGKPANSSTKKVMY